ncbi:MAG: hypothetical protein ACTSXL_00580 [Alphaproteobacteria bacterium]
MVSRFGKKDSIIRAISELKVMKEKKRSSPTGVVGVSEANGFCA